MATAAAAATRPPSPRRRRANNNNNNNNGPCNPRRLRGGSTTVTRNSNANNNGHKPTKMLKKREFPDHWLPSSSSTPSRGSTSSSSSSSARVAVTKKTPLAKYKTTLKKKNQQQQQPPQSVTPSRVVAAWKLQSFTWTLTVDTPGGHAQPIAIVRGIENMEQEEDDMNDEIMAEQQEEKEEDQDEYHHHHHHRQQQQQQQRVCRLAPPLKGAHVLPTDSQLLAVDEEDEENDELYNSIVSLEPMDLQRSFMAQTPKPNTSSATFNSVQYRTPSSKSASSGSQNYRTPSQKSASFFLAPTPPISNRHAAVASRSTNTTTPFHDSSHAEGVNEDEDADDSKSDDDESTLMASELTLDALSVLETRETPQNEQLEQQPRTDHDEGDDYDEEEAQDQYDDQASLQSAACYQGGISNYLLQPAPISPPDNALLDQLSDAASFGDETDKDSIVMTHMNDLLDTLSIAQSTICSVEEERNDDHDPIMVERNFSSGDEIPNITTRSAPSTSHQLTAGDDISSVTIRSASSLVPPRKPKRTSSTNKLMHHGPRQPIRTNSMSQPSTIQNSASQQQTLERQVIMVRRGVQATQSAPSAHSCLSSHSASMTEGDDTIENSQILPWSNLHEGDVEEGEESDSFSSTSSFSEDEDDDDNEEEESTDDESLIVRKYVEEMEMARVDHSQVILMNETDDEESIVEFYQRDRVTKMLVAMRSRESHGGIDDESTIEGSLVSPAVRQNQGNTFNFAKPAPNQYNGLYGGFKGGFELDLEPNDSAHDESITFMGSDEPSHLTEIQSMNSVGTLSMQSTLLNSMGQSPMSNSVTLSQQSTILSSLHSSLLSSSLDQSWTPSGHDTKNRMMNMSLPSIEENLLWFDDDVEQDTVQSHSSPNQEKWLAIVHETVKTQQPAPQSEEPSKMPITPKWSISMDSTDQKLVAKPKMPKRSVSMDSAQQKVLVTKEGSAVNRGGKKGFKKGVEKTPLKQSIQASPTTKPMKRAKATKNGSRIGGDPPHQPQSKMPTEVVKETLRDPSNFESYDPVGFMNEGVPQSMMQNSTLQRPSKIQPCTPKSATSQSSYIPNTTLRKPSRIEPYNPQDLIDELSESSPTNAKDVTLNNMVERPRRLRAPSMASMEPSFNIDTAEIFHDSSRSFAQLSFSGDAAVKRVTNANVMDTEMPDLDDIREQEILDKIERSKAKERAKKGRLFGGRRKESQKKLPGKSKDGLGGNSGHFLDNLWSFGAGSSDMAKNMSDMTAYE